MANFPWWHNANTPSLSARKLRDANSALSLIKTKTSSDTFFSPSSSCTTKLSESHEASDHRRSEEAELRPVSAAERRERVVARRNTLLMQMEEQQKLQGVARAARERLDERLRLGANRSLPAVPAYLCKQLLHNIPHTTETITPSGQRTRRVSKHQGGRLRSQGGGGIRGKEEVQERRTEEEEIPEVASQCSGDAIALGECSICLEGFGEVHSSMRLPCQHRFHTHCVTLWLRKRNSCPYCRAPQLLSTSSPREGSGWYHSDD